MTREKKYAEQLQALGVYDPAFDPEIHTLAIMERDHQRTLKAWRAEGSDVTSELYAAIERQRRDILAHRTSLGLTPQGLRRLRGATFAAERTPDEEEKHTVLGFVLGKRSDAV